MRTSRVWTLTPDAPSPRAISCFAPRPRGDGATPPSARRAVVRRPLWPSASPSAGGRARPGGSSRRVPLRPGFENVKGAGETAPHGPLYISEPRPRRRWPRLTAALVEEGDQLPALRLDACG